MKLFLLQLIVGMICLLIALLLFIAAISNNSVAALIGCMFFVWVIYVLIEK